MYFIELLREKYKNKKLKIFIDMDGVITDYNFNHDLDFKNKRPLKTNINTLIEVSKLDNVEVYILSICRKDYQIIEKNNWIDKYIPIIKKENRIIISKESNQGKNSELKCNALKEYVKNKTDEVIIHIDDDNEILKYLRDEINDIELYQDSSIID